MMIENRAKVRRALRLLEDVDLQETGELRQIVTDARELLEESLREGNVELADRRWRAPEHNKDSDCTLNDKDECQECGAGHGDPCPECGGRGFHNPDCSENAG